MAKRTSFPKANARDFHPTPLKPVRPLIPHLRGLRRYAEPCAGNGALIGHLSALKDLRCTYGGDIYPLRDGIVRRDAFDLRASMLGDAEAIITNPPWTRSKKDNAGYPLIPMAVHLSDILPTWLLLDADFMHIEVAGPIMRERCAKVVSVGRVRWMEGTDSDGYDNAAWYLFTNRRRATRFYGWAA